MVLIAGFPWSNSRGQRFVQDDFEETAAFRLHKPFSSIA